MPGPPYKTKRDNSLGLGSGPYRRKVKKPSRRGSASMTLEKAPNAKFSPVESVESGTGSVSPARPRRKTAEGVTPRTLNPKRKADLAKKHPATGGQGGFLKRKPPGGSRGRPAGPSRGDNQRAVTNDPVPASSVNASFEKVGQGNGAGSVSAVKPVAYTARKGRRLRIKLK